MKLYKLRLAVNDNNGSYLISSTNKGGYGNRINRISGFACCGICSSAKNRHSRKWTLNLSINDKWII